MGEHHPQPIVERGWALVLARFIIPSLVVLVGVAGTYVLNNLTHSNEAIWAKLSELQGAISALHETVSVMDSRQLSQSENQNQQTADIHNQIDDHEHRLRQLEHHRP